MREMRCYDSISFTVTLVDFGFEHLVNKTWQFPMTLAIVLSIGLVKDIIWPQSRVSFWGDEASVAVAFSLFGNDPQ